MRLVAGRRAGSARVPEWRTWAGTATALPRRVVPVRDRTEVVAAVRAAVDEGLPVRAVGSGHSFTDCAVTDGVALVPAPETRVEGLAPDGEGAAVTVWAGTRLRDLNRALDGLGLALENLGDVDAQTVAGALATGTHGTGARFGGLASQVAALELVLADGSVVTCSATERPDLFAAARVGLGAFGVVTYVTLRAVPAFGLRAAEEPARLTDLLAGFAGVTASADHVDCYWWPGTDRALVKRHHRVAAAEARAPLPRWRALLDDEVLANGAYGVLCRTARAAPRLAPAVREVASRAVSTRRYADVSHRVFCTPRRVRFVEAEWAVPREATPDLLAGVRDLVARHRWPVVFPVEVRVAAADDAWLSTAYGRDTGYVAVHQYAGMPYEEYFAAVEECALSLDGRPHWGKLHGCGTDTLAARYPRTADVRRVRDEVDPERRLANAYVTRVLG